MSASERPASRPASTGGGKEAAAPSLARAFNPLSWRNARRLRRVVQAGVFAVFVVVLVLAGQRTAPTSKADIFFRFDPLAALTTMLSQRAWLPRFELALVTLALTLVLGRVWCGWICPLGTLLEWFTFKRARRRAHALPPRLRQTKYVLLLVIVVMAALGSLTLLVLDPLALLTRTMAVSVLPALNVGVTRLEEVLYHVGALQPRIDWFEAHARGVVVPATQQLFVGGLLVALTLVAVVALNALADRFWCRALCPLGALLGLLAKIAVLRPVVDASCTSCARCAHACRLDAIEVDDGGGRRRGRGPAAGRRRRHLGVHHVPRLPRRLPRVDDHRSLAATHALAGIRPRSPRVPRGDRHRGRRRVAPGHRRVDEGAGAGPAPPARRRR